MWFIVFIIQREPGKHIYVVTRKNMWHSSIAKRKCVHNIPKFIMLLAFAVELSKMRLCECVFSRISRHKGIPQRFSAVTEIPRGEIKLLTGIAHLSEEYNIRQHRKLHIRERASFLYRPLDRKLNDDKRQTRCHILHSANCV